MWRSVIVLMVDGLSMELDMKFLLLHEGKNDEGIRAFFAEVWELYVKVSGMC
jgi:hypothetical protein